MRLSISSHELKLERVGHEFSSESQMCANRMIGLARPAFRFVPWDCEFERRCYDSRRAQCRSSETEKRQMIGEGICFSPACESVDKSGVIKVGQRRKFNYKWSAASGPSHDTVKSTHKLAHDRNDLTGCYCDGTSQSIDIFTTSFYTSAGTVGPLDIRERHNCPSLGCDLYIRYWHINRSIIPIDSVIKTIWNKANLNQTLHGYKSVPHVLWVEYRKRDMRQTPSRQSCPKAWKLATGGHCSINSAFAPQPQTLRDQSEH